MPETVSAFPGDAAGIRCLYGDAIALLLGSRTASVHPLGFQFILLRAGPSAGYVRIHLWERSRDAAVAHSHSSEQESVVLAGALRNTIWTTEAPSGEPQLPLFSVRKDGDSRHYVYQGGTGLSLISSSVVEAGERYIVPVGVFHTSECVTDICVTIVARSGTIFGESRIVGAPSTSVIRYPTARLGSNRTASFIAALEQARSELRE